jgi:hypothetical protein
LWDLDTWMMKVCGWSDDDDDWVGRVKRKKRRQ